MATAGKWVLWVRWFGALALMIALAYLAGRFRDSVFAFWLFICFIVAIPWFYKPIKQRIELALDGQPVSLRIEMNLLGRIRWHWQSDVATSAETLGWFYGVPLWFEREISVGSTKRRVLVYAKPYPNGFLVSSGSQNYPFAVVHDAFCF
jgi:uncharacterized protein (DUF58 family)